MFEPGGDAGVALRRPVPDGPLHCARVTPRRIALAALVLLVADADSTLFLYTDRLVVLLAGVIVLVPAIALIVGGWAIHQVGRRLDRADDA